MSKDLMSLIVGIAQELNVQQGMNTPAELGSETALFGQQGILDSLGLVSLIVALEQAIEDNFGVCISLANEKAMSQRSSPYRTLGSLAEYAGELLKGKSEDG